MTSFNKNLTYLLLLLFFVFATHELLSQAVSSSQIKGTIQDEQATPLAAVTITLEGTTLGSTTNQQGEFLIRDIPAGTYTLVATSVGYAAKKQNIVLEGKNGVTLHLILNITTQQLSEVTVVAGNQRKYLEEVSSIASRTTTPLKDIPQSIQVVGEQVLKDQQAILLQDAIRNFSGINQFSGYNDYTLRGFRSGAGNFSYNGQRLGASYYTPQVTYNIASIEAIKGPASVLYGAASPGGIININTKLPTGKERYAANFTIGSFNTYRFAGDAMGRITRNNKVSYRLVVGYENSGHLQQFYNTQNFFINPSFTFLPTSNTTLTLTTSYFHQNEKGGGWYNRGIMAPGGNVNLLGRNWTHHEKDDKHHDYLTNLQLLAKHTFNDHFSLHLLARYQHYDYLQQYHHIRWNSYVDSTKTIRREFRDFADKTDDYFINAYGIYGFSTGKIKHTLVAGVDYGNSDRNYVYKSSRANVPGLNILNPVYGLGEVTTYRGESYHAIYDEPKHMLGFYLQDQVEISSQLKALVGLRYDRYSMKSTTRDKTASVTDPRAGVELTKDTSTTSALIPRIGLVYQPVPFLSLYSSYSQSFEPQYSNLTSQGGPFDPERGKQIELGVKGDFFKKRLQATAAVYQIRKVNMLTADPNDPELLIEGNEATGKGLELNVTGTLFNGLTILANYAYNETRITKSPQENPNTIPWFENAPNTVANLWAVYTCNLPLLSGLSLGGGLYHVGKRHTFKPGFVVPAYTTLDGMVSYRFKNYSLALNLYNLTNKRYFSGAFHEDALWVGAPRSFRLNIGVSF